MRAVKEVAYYLGNTPTVARNSYIDPRVFDRYRDGETISGKLSLAADEPGHGDPGPGRAGRARAAVRKPDPGRPAGFAQPAVAGATASTASSRVGRIVKI